MLDNSQAIVTQTTIANATELAVAIAANIFGNTIGDNLAGEEVSRSAIASVVIADIKKDFFPQGGPRA